MENILYGGRMQGKSWAQLQAIFQTWLRAEYPNVGMLDSKTIDLMWAAWRASHGVHIAGLRAENAMLREDNENLRQELSCNNVSEGVERARRLRNTLTYSDVA